MPSLIITLVDMENGEDYKEHPDETLELSESLITDNISYSKLDLYYNTVYTIKI